MEGQVVWQVTASWWGTSHRPSLWHARVKGQCRILERDSYWMCARRNAVLSRNRPGRWGAFAWETSSRFPSRETFPMWCEALDLVTIYWDLPITGYLYRIEYRSNNVTDFFFVFLDGVALASLRWVGTGQCAGLDASPGECWSPWQGARTLTAWEQRGTACRMLSPAPRARWVDATVGTFYLDHTQPKLTRETSKKKFSHSETRI